MAKIRVYDSFLDCEYPEHRIFAVAYEPVWQLLRTQLSFRSVEDALSTQVQLNEYLWLAVGPVEQSYRLYRVYNYMNAVPIGQPTPDGLMRVPRDAEPTIVAFRKEIAFRYGSAGPPSEWDWHTTRKAIAVLWKEEPDSLYRHWKLLGTTRANKARMVRQSKPELHHYLQMIKESMP